MSPAPRDAVAVLNAGSSSLKFSLFGVHADTLQLELHGQIDGIGSSPHFVVKHADGKVRAQQAWPNDAAFCHDDALDHLLGWVRDELTGHTLLGVGHRVVHGGLQFSAPTVVTPAVLRALQALIPLAPLHQPHNLAPIARITVRRPDLPQVACFDTAFHHRNPELAQMFALPRALHDQGVRRYGFHGLSYEYIASVLPNFSARAAAGRTVVLHLGNGASLCALQAGRSIASSMAFSALDGVPMGTRSGAVDPGVLIYLMDHQGLDARGLEHMLYHESGLLGVSGISGDMRVLQGSAEPRARLAIELFAYRIRREIGSLAAALGGLDAIVFTAGIGENSSQVREQVCASLGWLGVELDARANASGGPRISPPESRCEAWAIATHEELMIARHTLQLLRPGAAQAISSTA
jgi:acetate kinase